MLRTQDGRQTDRPRPAIRRLALLHLPLLLALVGSALISAPALADSRAQPPWTDSPSTMERALKCEGDLTGHLTPVLLVPGTTATPEATFGSTYMKVLSDEGRAWCAISLPMSATGDIQVAGEYVAYAVETMYEAAQERISIIGVSQGGMVPRWAIKWWPQTRHMIDDLIGLAPSNHGSLLFDAICVLTCPAALWQQSSASMFLKTLNEPVETYAGISYTQVHSALDEVVLPATGPQASSPLRTGDGDVSNILLQDVCPLNLADHILTGTTDPVSYALVRDALAHAGPADPARLDPAVCSELVMPGVPALNAVSGTAGLGLTIVGGLLGSRFLPAEPVIKQYAR